SQIRNFLFLSAVSKLSTGLNSICAAHKPAPYKCKNRYVDFFHSCATIALPAEDMNEEPPKDLATRAFQKRVLDEFATVRREIAVIRSEQVSMQSDIAEIHAQQATMAKNIAAIDQRLTTLEKTVDDRLKETRPIWE